MIELITIGDEVLTGETVNSNAAHIGQTLFEAGYFLERETVLPDDRKKLHEGLKQAYERSKIVITTGGLGPTLDDHTREVVSDLLSMELKQNSDVADHLKSRYGEDLSTIEDQSTIPEKAKPLMNDVGTAPGMIIDEEKLFILLPGVPMELKPLLKNDVLPYLLEHYPPKQKFARKEVHVHGIPEADVDKEVRKLDEKYEDVQLGIYPGARTLVVRLTADEESKEEAEEMLKKPLNELFEIYENHLFEQDTIEGAVHDLLTKNGQTLSTAESCTGGAIASTLTQQEGASEYFLGTIVSYSNQMKIDLLDVPEELLEKHGAVSKEVSEAMFKGVLKKTGSDYAIAVTGIAGPGGGTPEKPVGTVWAAVGKKGEDPEIFNVSSGGSREAVIRSTVEETLGRLLHLAKSR